MTSKLTVAQLLAADWPGLGDDSIGKHARKALAAVEITPASAATMKRADLSRVPGLGMARLERVEKCLRDLADAKVREAAEVAREAARTMPGHCPDCGDRRATHPRNVTADIRGCLRHVSQPGAPIQPWCDSCHAHHRALLGILVDA